MVFSIHLLRESLCVAYNGPETVFFSSEPPVRTLVQPRAALSTACSLHTRARNDTISGFASPIHTANLPWPFSAAYKSIVWNQTFIFAGCFEVYKICTLFEPLQIENMCNCYYLCNISVKFPIFCIIWLKSCRNRFFRREFPKDCRNCGKFEIIAGSQ